jgi:hypothetical protein
MTNHESSLRIGIDVGRVLVGASTDGGEPDTSFLTATDDEAIRIPPEPGAFDVVRDAVERTGGHVYVVSKCGPRIATLTLAWMEHQRFFELTGVERRNVFFVRKRPEKRDVAARHGLTHFVDDRLDVLGAMVGLVPRLVWFGGNAREAPEWASPAHDWAAARSLLR